MRKISISKSHEIYFRSGDNNDREEYQSQFATDLAGMDFQELNVNVAMGEGPEEFSNNEVKWARPVLTPSNLEKDSVVFQQIDIDYYVGQPMSGMPGAPVRTLQAINLTNVSHIQMIF